MHTIQSIQADSILDSRNIPTLSITVTTNDGAVGTCAVPSGASTGKWEAYELRDNGTSKGGVAKAQEIIHTVIEPALIGKKITDQKGIDEVMCVLDGTKNKEVLGGNSMIGVSVACGKAAAHALGKEFYEYLAMLAESTSDVPSPRLYFNLINGGKHATTHLAFQEYHLVPMTPNITEALGIAQKVQDALGDIIFEQYGVISRGDEGGYAVPTEDVHEPLRLLSAAVRNCSLDEKVMFALDVAATSFYDTHSEMYTIGGKNFSKEGMHAIYESIVSSFPVLSIEDPFYEEDFESFAKLQESLPNIFVVGDDLTVTNKERVKKAYEMNSISGLIIKPNQIGTLTETIETVTYAQKNGIQCIVSHRSGETLDDMIADITEAFKCFGMKSGARGPREREVKYDRLATIHNHI